MFPSYSPWCKNCHLAFLQETILILNLHLSVRKNQDVLTQKQTNTYRPVRFILTLNLPNATIAEFANTVDPDETPNNKPSHNKPSHLDIQCLPSSLQLKFQNYTV